MKQNNENVSFKDTIIAHDQFDDSDHVGKDISGSGNDASLEGTTKPILETVGGRKAVTFAGGKNSTCYLGLPSKSLKDIGDHTIRTAIPFLTLILSKLNQILCLSPPGNKN